MPRKNPKPLFEDDELLGFDLGEAGSIGRGAEQERIEIRESRGKFHTQKLELGPEEEIVSKMSLSRPSRDRGRAESLATNALDLEEPDRSSHALAIDRSLKAEVAPDWETYTKEPNEYDWPGIDLP